MSLLPPPSPHPQGKPRKPHDYSSQLPPYVLNALQRRVVLLIQQVGPMNVERLMAMMDVPSGAKPRIKRSVENLSPNFLMPRGDGAYQLTPRAMEIAQNITASAMDGVPK